MRSALLRQTPRRPINDETVFRAPFFQLLPCAAVILVGVADWSGAVAAERKATLFVCGDSTARNLAKGKNGEPCLGWGTPLADYFEAGRVEVANVAHEGQSSRTYFNLPGDWPSVVPRIQAGDFVRLVFGTFVHICDVVRINRRNGGHGLSFIELKEGRVNAIVAKHLEKYAATPEALDQIKVDAEIAPEHRKQAQRMQKQRIRFNQTAKVLRDDEGTDIKSNKSIRMNHQLINEVHYYKQFDESAKIALASGVSAITVNYCLHIGMASGADMKDRIRLAKRAAALGLSETAVKAEGGLKIMPFGNSWKAIHFGTVLSKE